MNKMKLLQQQRRIRRQLKKVQEELVKASPLQWSEWRESRKNMVIEVDGMTKEGVVLKFRVGEKTATLAMNHLEDRQLEKVYKVNTESDLIDRLEDIFWSE